MNDPLHLIEQATYGGMVEVRASVLLYLLGMLDGLLKGELLTEDFIQSLFPSTPRTPA